MAAYTIPITPLVSLVVMHYILSKAYPDEKWSMVWTFQADPSIFNGSVLSPHISHHRTYASIISQESKKIVDILAIWAYDAGGDDEPEKPCWLDEVIKGGIEAAKANNESDDPKLRNQPWTFYTCDDRLAFLEFIEAGARVERAESEWVKLEEAEKKKSSDEKKKKLEEEREARRLVERQKMIEEARAARLAKGESLPSESNSKGADAGASSVDNGDGRKAEETAFKAPFEVSQPATKSVGNLYYIVIVVGVSILVALIGVYYRSKLSSSLADNIQ